MFDLTSSKLLILGLVALIVVGPKDLPLLLRTIGKYVGMIKRQANEFRAQFDEAMREQELANLKSEMDAVKRDIQDTVTAAGHSVKSDLTAATREIDATLQTPSTIHAPSPPVDYAAILHGETHDDSGKLPHAEPPVAPAQSAVVHTNGAAPADPALKAGA